MKKIYNADKTQILNRDEIDLNKGYLKAEKLFIAHHEAREFRNAVYKDRVVKEVSGGVSIYKDLISPAVEAKEAYDEYEEIQVYVPYTKEELKDSLRYKRKPLLEAFDKWEKAVLRGRAEESKSVMSWYYELLDLKAEAFESVPEEVRYYL